MRIGNIACDCSEAGAGWVGPTCFPSTPHPISFNSSIKDPISGNLPEPPRSFSLLWGVPDLKKPDFRALSLLWSVPELKKPDFPVPPSTLLRIYPPTLWHSAGVGHMLDRVLFHLLYRYPREPCNSG